MALPTVLTAATPFLVGKMGMFSLVSFTLSSPPVLPAGWLSPAPNKNTYLSSSYVRHPLLIPVDNTYQADMVSFDASRSSSVYGDNITVQPATYYINIWKRIE